MKKVTLTETKKRKWKRRRNKKELGWKFIRINPDAENYEIVETGKIKNHIIESTKKFTKQSTKTSLIDKIPKLLLELELEESHSVKSKCLQFIVRNSIKMYKDEW